MNLLYKYSITELKIIFPKMDFSFLNNILVSKLVDLVNGRIVGGIVRDSLLGIKTHDLDIATPYLPMEVMDILEKAGFHPVGTGIEYGTISLFLKEVKVEITSLRKDVKNFGRKATVEFGGTWEDDSKRRDFTFNALFIALEQTEVYVYDYHNGIQDLQNGIVRFIGDYEARIQEDYLRILRFIRFFIRYSFDLNYQSYIQTTMPNFSNHVKDMVLLSMERVLMELQAILLAVNWKLGIEMMNFFGVSKLFFKEDVYIVNFDLSSLQEVDLLLVRLMYTLSSVDSKIISNLPLHKERRNFILFYQRFLKDPSIENIYYIWQKTKTLGTVNFILQLYEAQVAHSSESKYNTSLKDEDFESIRKKITLVHLSGPERGEEEKQIKIEFIRQNILIS